MWFQSTHSLRSATYDYYPDAQENHVSIHALLAECDCFGEKHKGQNAGFNPRTPCGVRHSYTSRCSLLKMFQSTHSLRSATYTQLAGWPHIAVSIHALLAECDK